MTRGKIPCRGLNSTKGGENGGVARIEIGTYSEGHGKGKDSGAFKKPIVGGKKKTKQ